MPCNSPIDAWPSDPERAPRKADGTPSRAPVFSPRLSFQGAKPFHIACGRCAGCRLDKRRQWGLRIMHEASQHEANSFLTMTIADEHRDRSQSVSVRQVQLFNKRLRHLTGGHRFVVAGEYGEHTKREHYHQITFGHDFMADAKPWSKTQHGVLYRSPSLEAVWGLGQVLIGSVTLQSAEYVAGYVRKKLDGAAAEEYRRQDVDPVTGEVREWYVSPPFFLTSRRPGIGASWFERFKDDAFPSDFLVMNGKRVTVPRYYLNRLEADERAAQIERRKRAGLSRSAAERGDSRLLVKNECTELRAERLRRHFDEAGAAS
jgi:hypothetical protein